MAAEPAAPIEPDSSVSTRQEPMARKLGRYVLRYAVAQGGMATVYLAQLPGAHGFEKWVAVKLIHEHLAKDRKFVTMFLDEARITSRIQHPHVCQVTDFGEQDGVPYLVMEYLHGETLSSVVRHGWKARDMPLWISARIVADAARGLHAAHELRGPDKKLVGLVHRDVSPQNILVLYDGAAKIMDFGVVHATQRETMTTAGEIKGKFAYMSPEQLRGKALDRRNDVWALGVVLWEACAGKRLFAGAGEGEIAVKVIDEPIPRPSDILEGFPLELEAIIMAALERDPNARTPTAKALADSLEKWLGAHSAVTGDLHGTAQVGEWMAHRFADKRSVRDAMLAAPTSTAPVPEILLNSQNTLGSRITTSEPRAAAHGSLPPPSARFAKLGIIGGAAAVGLVAGWLALRPAEGPATTPPPIAAPDPATPTADPTSLIAAPRITPPTSDPAEPVPPPPPAIEAAPTPPPATLSRHDRPPEKRPPRTTDPAPRGGTGTLNLIVPSGSVEVSLGGQSLGRTPLIGRPLPAGRHTLTLRSPATGVTKTVTVTIRAGEQTRQSVPF